MSRPFFCIKKLGKMTLGKSSGNLRSAFSQKVYEMGWSNYLSKLFFQKSI